MLDFQISSLDLEAVDVSDMGEGFVVLSQQGAKGKAESIALSYEALCDIVAKLAPRYA